MKKSDILMVIILFLLIIFSFLFSLFSYLKLKNELEYHKELNNEITRIQSEQFIEISKGFNIAQSKIIAIEDYLNITTSTE